jgi:hypothetical protein
MRVRSSTTVAAWLVPLAWLIAVLAILGPSRDASACGVFAIPRPTDGALAAHLPFLSVEQVLLVWDKDTGTEDFVRETRFSGADQAFGFVVPVPTKPEVAGVATAPFDALRASYPFEAPPSRGLTGLSGGGPVSAAAAPPPPVVVLSQQRIGPFTAFTLAANDAGAFEHWLGRNGFAISEDARPWLAHYVTLKFFFVALRYERGAEHSAAMTSQTVRIRFHTPNPYYPYMEPTHALPDGADAAQRMLAGWLVTREPMRPVASREDDATHAVRWERPWTDGESYRVPSAGLRALLGKDLGAVIPEATALVVQTFHDFKSSREGFGDAVFAPVVPEKLSGADVEARRFLLPVVDPSLLSPGDVTPGASAAAPEPDPSSAPSTPAPPTAELPLAPRAPRPSTGACAIATPGSPATGDGPWLAIGVTIALLGARKARGVLCALGAACAVVGCHASRDDAPASSAIDAASEDAPAVAASTVSTLRPAPTTRAEREQNALAILEGEPAAGGIREALEDLFPMPPMPPTPPVEGVATAKVVSGDADAFASTLLSGKAGVLRCYRRGLQDDATMEGKLQVDIATSPDGAVATKVLQNTGLSLPAARCCASVLERAAGDLPRAKAAHAVVELVFSRARD